MRVEIRVLLEAFVFLVCAREATSAQIIIQYSGLPRYELGAQFSGVQLNGAVTGGSLGLGGRFSYNYNQYLSLDTEVSGYNFSSDRLDTVVGLFGARVGYTSRDFGIYVKLRPGLIHFKSNGDFIPPVRQHPTQFAFDTGVVLERYFVNHMCFRFDLGRMFVNYGGGSYKDPVTGQVTHLGVPGGTSVAFGVGAHW